MLLYQNLFQIFDSLLRTITHELDITILLLLYQMLQFLKCTIFGTSCNEQDVEKYNFEPLKSCVRMNPRNEH